MRMVRDDFVWHEGQKLRTGYTTGACATAAAKAAALMCINQQIIDYISIVTPSKVILYLDVLEAIIEPHCAIAAIKKDGGDDIDVTHGMLIYAKVTLNQTQIIQITGGIGIGIVTRKGIPVEVGEYAINPVPRQMIESAVREVIGIDLGADILIFAPEGEIRSKKTYNPRLGIIGGISILGTTGIVVPMSEDSLKKSLSLELAMKRAEGLDHIVLVPGNYGHRFVEQKLGIDKKYVVTMSNFVGYMLKEAKRLDFKYVLLVGHFGKLIKIAAGIFHTHSHIADARIETLITHLALLGAPTALIQEVYECLTTESAMEVIANPKYDAIYKNLVYKKIARKIKVRIEDLFKLTDNTLFSDVIFFAYDDQILGSSCALESLASRFNSHSEDV